MRILASVLTIAAALPLLSQSRFDDFSNAHCGVRFTVPHGWRVVVSRDHSSKEKDFPHGLRCVVGLQPPGWIVKRRNDETGLLREFPVEVVVVHRPFLEVARTAGFNRVSDFWPYSSGLLAEYPESDWMIAVRQGSVHAGQFRTACCQGVIGDTWGHAETKDGSRATVTATIAVVNDRKNHSAVTEGDGAAPSRAIVTHIANSIEFRP